MAGTVFAQYFLGEFLTDARAELFWDVVETIIAILAVYVGAKIKERKDDG